MSILLDTSHIFHMHQLQLLTSGVSSACGPVLQLLLLALQFSCFPLQLLLLFDQVSLGSSCRCLVGDGRASLSIVTTSLLHFSSY